MRILHVYSGNLFGGVETMLVTLARQRHLCLAMEPHFALCFAGRLSAELHAAGATVYGLGTTRISRPWTVWQSQQRLAHLLRQQQFDIVVCHAPWSQALFGGVVRAAGVPLIFWVHDASKHRHWLERWAALIQPSLAVCTSQFTAARFRARSAHVPVETIYCPVALATPCLTENARAAQRSRWQTPRDATVIIQVSRMEAWKGQRLLLEALGLLRHVPGWVCWQLGGAQRRREARYLEALRRTASRLQIADRVRFLGERADVSSLLAAADIHCQPNSQPEPFGIAFIEALSARLPVVTTALGGAMEILDAACGFCVPPGDVQALATVLQRLLQDPALRGRLGAAGPERARSLCDPCTQLHRIHALCRSLVPQKGAR